VEPRRHKTAWASAVCYGDSFTFYLRGIISQRIEFFSLVVVPDFSHTIMYDQFYILVYIEGSFLIKLRDADLWLT
jgi:hypothetical protein